MNIKASAALLGVGRTKFHELRKLPGFPPARRMPGRKRGSPSWDADELRQWHRSLPIYQPKVTEPQEQQAK